jgi:hypothetical protein
VDIKRLKEIAAWNPPKDAYYIMDNGAARPCAEEAVEMARELLALQWQPITENDFPSEGNEVLGSDGSVLVVDGAMANFSLLVLQIQGWTHFRPINPPQEASDAL